MSVEWKYQKFVRDIADMPGNITVRQTKMQFMAMFPMEHDARVESIKDFMYLCAMNGLTVDYEPEDMTYRIWKTRHPNEIKAEVRREFSTLLRRATTSMNSEFDSEMRYSNGDNDRRKVRNEKNGAKRILKMFSSVLRAA